MGYSQGMTTTTTSAALPRTVRRIVADVEAIEIDGVRGQIDWTGDRAFRVLIPIRGVTCDAARTKVVSLRNVGQVGWYVRDGVNHIGGQLDDVDRAIDNIREGRNPLAPRRGRRGGTHAGRDRFGRFVSDSR